MSFDPAARVALLGTFLLGNHTSAPGSLSNISTVPAVSIAFTAVGSFALLLASCFVLLSALAFASFRRCACNWMLLYTAAVNVFQGTNLFATSVFHLQHGAAMLPRSEWCQLNGAINLSSYSGQSSIATFYFIVLLMFKGGNDRAWLGTLVVMVLNTIGFAWAPLAAMVQGQFSPVPESLNCHLQRQSESISGYRALRMVGIFCPLLGLVLGMACLGFVLLKTHHMRNASSNNMNGFRMVRNRAVYSPSFIAYVVIILVNLARDVPVNGWATACLVWIALFQMVFLIFSECLTRRWRVRLFGPGPDRIIELSREVFLRSEPSKSGNSITRRFSLTNYGAASSTRLSAGGRVSLTAPGVAETPLRRKSSSNISNSTPRDTLPTAPLVALDDPEMIAAIDKERHDPFVHKTLSSVLDDMGDRPPPPEAGGAAGSQQVLVV